LNPPQTITVFSRNRSDGLKDALERVLDLAVEAGVEVRVPPEEVAKHGLEPRPGVSFDADPVHGTDLALVLGGDGTILSTLRRYAGSGVPVFAINFGAIGFLSTVENGELQTGMETALAGDFDVLELPALLARTSSGDHLGVNDISFHRRPEGRVAWLGYTVEGEELGAVRCDGLVAATPAGSTGYNLANGGPVLAWGVEGYVVSFIAPHTLTARALVVAPNAELEVSNQSDEEPVDMSADGRQVCSLDPQGSVTIRFEPGRTLLAQRPGASFYHRLRDKFGQLSF
jgi:NAD+ kinase